MPLRHRRDGNHKALVNALQRLGWTVCDTSQGCQVGAPDLFIAKGGRVVACEVKAAKGKVGPWQEAFLKAWPAEVAILRTIEDVVALNRSGQGVSQPSGAPGSPGANP